MLAMKPLKKTRAVTYRRYGIPALILEGKWLTEKYQLQIGDVVDIEYQPKGIQLQKNSKLSVERKRKLKEIQEIRNKTYDDLKRNQEGPHGTSSEHSR